MIWAPTFSSPVRATRDLLDGGDHADQGGPAAGDDPLVGRGSGGVEGVLDPGLDFLHLGLGRRAHADDRDSAGDLRQALLELLLVVLALGLVDLAAELVDPLDDVRPLAGALDDRRAVLVHLDLLGPAELGELEVLELDPEILADHRAAGQDRHVAEHRLAAVAEAGGLHGADVEDAAELVDHQVARASPSTSSAMMISGWPDCATFSSRGISSRRLAIFFSWSRIRASSRTASIVVGLVTK